MNFVVIGTDHRMQSSDCGLEAVLRSFLSKQFFEPLTTIAEEYSENLGHSVCQRLAAEYGLCWCNLDMTDAEKRNGGILEDQRGRPESQGKIAYRVSSDETRENAWVQKLTTSGSGTTLVICGFLHFESLVEKLRSNNCTVDARVYLETVPEIKPSTSSG